MSVWAKIANLITRGKVVNATVAQRTFLQISALDGEQFQNIELLLPPGYVARPVSGADVTILQANGVRGHALALCGDNTADVVANLQPGEFGLSMGGTRTIIFRSTGIVLTDPVQIILHAPDVFHTTDGTALHKLARDDHTHDYQPGSGATTVTSTPINGLT